MYYQSSAFSVTLRAFPESEAIFYDIDAGREGCYFQEQTAAKAA